MDTFGRSTTSRSAPRKRRKLSDAAKRQAELGLGFPFWDALIGAGGTPPIGARFVEPSRFAAASNADDIRQAVTGGGTVTAAGNSVPNAVPNANANVATDPWSGFAGQYAPGGQGILESDPQILIRDTLKAMGFNPSSGMMDLLAEDADALQWLAMLTLGQGGQNSLDFEDYINFANDWVEGQMTPGGETLDSEAMINAILDAPEGSAIAALLAGGTPQEQAAALQGLMGAAIMGKTPLMRRAMLSALEDKTTDWLSEQAQGTGGYDGLLANYLQRGGRGLFGGY